MYLQNSQEILFSFLILLIWVLIKSNSILNEDISLSIAANLEQKIYELFSKVLKTCG